MSAALVAGAAVYVRFLGVQTASFVRQRVYDWLTPTHVLEVVTLLVVGGLIVSLPPTDGLAAGAVARLRALGRRCSALVAAVPTVVVLTVVVAIASVLRIALGAASTIPLVLGDELLYVDVAKGFARFGEPLLRGKLDLGQSLLYPLFLSPAYALAATGGAAFAAVKAMNAIAMSLTAVPAYFLARRVVSRGWSLGVAALAVCTPWLGYTSLTMTEALFYPAFVGFAVVLARMLEQPTRRRQVVALLTLGVLVLIRPQALVLVASVVAAVLVGGYLEGSVRRAWTTYRLTFALLALAIGAALIAAAAGLPVPASGYSGLFNVRYGVVGVAKWAVWNLATYELALGVVALVAFPVALRQLLRRDAPSSERAFGLVASTLSIAMLLSVAALSASPYGLGILHERNLFYVTPLVLTALAFWLSNGLPRPRALAVASAVAAVAVAAAVPERVLRLTNNVDGPTASFVMRFKSIASGVPAPVWLVAAAVVGAAAFLACRRPFFPVAAVVLAFASVATASDYGGPFTPSQDRALGWVDRALPSGATATLVHVDLTRPDVPCAEVAEYEQQGLLVWTEFFNTSVDRLVHVFGTRGRDNLTAPLLTVGSGGELLDAGRPLSPRYAVVDSRQPIAGTRIARFELASLRSTFQDGASLTLWKVAPPLRLGSPPSPLPPRADGRGC